MRISSASVRDLSASVGLGQLLLIDLIIRLVSGSDSGVCTCIVLSMYVVSRKFNVIIPDSIVVSIVACHAIDPGSIPGQGAFYRAAGNATFRSHVKSPSVSFLLVSKGNCGCWHSKVPVQVPCIFKIIAPPNDTCTKAAPALTKGPSIGAANQGTLQEPAIQGENCGNIP